MKKEIGTQKLKEDIVTRFNKAVDYYGISDYRQYVKYYNRLGNERLSNKKKVFVSIARNKKNKNKRQILQIGFSENGAIPIDTRYIDKKACEIIMVEFNS